MDELLSRCVCFGYPRHNIHGIPSKIERRRMRVLGIRDCHKNPIEQETMELHPGCRRGRWLLTGLDLDRCDERSFWYESMTDVHEIDFRPDPFDKFDVVATSDGVPCVMRVQVTREQAIVCASAVNRLTHVHGRVAFIEPSFPKEFIPFRERLALLVPPLDLCISR
jgi:hypothetical protein